MTLTTHVLASGSGWTVTDTVCTAGPRDRVFEEVHGTTCIGAVVEGTFQYRTESGRAVLAPGGMILGNAGACFE
jgi:AraC family transcriptional regulator